MPSPSYLSPRRPHMPLTPRTIASPEGQDRADLTALLFDSESLTQTSAEFLAGAVIAAGWKSRRENRETLQSIRTLLDANAGSLPTAALADLHNLIGEAL